MWVVHNTGVQKCTSYPQNDGSIAHFMSSKPTSIQQLNNEINRSEKHGRFLQFKVEQEKQQIQSEQQRRERVQRLVEFDKARTQNVKRERIENDASYKTALQSKRHDGEIDDFRNKFENNNNKTLSRNKQEFKIQRRESETTEFINRRSQEMRQQQNMEKKRLQQQLQYQQRAYVLQSQADLRQQRKSESQKQIDYVRKEAERLALIMEKQRIEENRNKSQIMDIRRSMSASGSRSKSLPRASQWSRMQ